LSGWTLRLRAPGLSASCRSGCSRAPKRRWRFWRQRLAVRASGMRKDLSAFLRDAANCLRDLALQAPDSSNELRRLAEELEHEAEQAERDGRRWGEDAA